jgi:hypothetical protein
VGARAAATGKRAENSAPSSGAPDLRFFASVLVRAVRSGLTRSAVVGSIRTAPGPLRSRVGPLGLGEGHARSAARQRDGDGVRGEGPGVQVENAATAAGGVPDSVRTVAPTVSWTCAVAGSAPDAEKPDPQRSCPYTPAPIGRITTIRIVHRGASHAERGMGPSPEGLRAAPTAPSDEARDG